MLLTLLCLMLFAPIAFRILASGRPRLLVSSIAMALLFLFAPAVTLAQDVAATAPAGLGAIWVSALAWLLTPAGLSTAIAVLGGGATLIFGGKAIVWELRFAKFVKNAFNVVEDLNTDPALVGKLDKEAAGLKALNDLMVAKGWRPPTADEQAQAKLAFRVMNGEAEAATAVQANALIAAAQASGQKAADKVVTPGDALKALTDLVAQKTPAQAP
jgi:hypothetical protein